MIDFNWGLYFGVVFYLGKEIYMPKSEKKEIIISDNRDFKGVWISDRLYLTREFTPNEKFVLIEIHSLTKKNKKCFASNKHFANFVGLKENTIQKMLLKFEKAGYIKRIFEYKEDSKEIKQRIIKLTNKFYESFVNESEEPRAESETLDCEWDVFNSIWGYGEKSIERDGKKSTGVVEKKSEISNPSIKCNNMLSNTDIKYNNDIHAFNPSEKNEGLKEIHASCYHTKPVSAPKKKRVGYLKPGEFTADDLYKHLYQRSLRYCLHNGKDEYDARDFARVVHYFYMAYKKKMGQDHPFLNDGAFERVADAYFHPPEYIFDGDLTSVDNYAMMIDRFLETNFGERKKNEYGYDNEIEIDPTISLFMAGEFREHIAMHLFEEP